LVHSTHGHGTGVEATNLRIIHGTGNSPERTDYGRVAPVGSNARIDNPNKEAVMDDVFSIMLDVTGLVSRGSDRASMEARRIAAERASRAAPSAVDQPAVTVSKTAERSFVSPRRWLKIGFAPR